MAPHHVSELDGGSPLRVYGSEISYFTGKLEAYLRYKGIDYQRVALTPLVWNRVARKTGARQMPAVELPDGRWVTDTTPIIEWIERQHPEPAVIPEDPFQAFASRLLEDYADEWLWRPALHYRWSYRRDALLLSRRIVDELLRPIPVPAGLKRLLIRRRQMRRYVRGDGVTDATRAHVEGIYLKSLDQLGAILETRSFLLGQRPTLADFGFFASMFRHFGLDPTPAAIMLERSPAVWAWLGRVWHGQAVPRTGELLGGVPSDWGPLLDEVGSAYLPYLVANARAWQENRPRFDVDIQGVPYRELPTSRYRVWCLERLRTHLEALPPEAANQARTLLEIHGCWEPLWAIEAPGSGYDPENRAPFGGGLAVFDS
jgi:glutathione S-transferase